MYCKCIAIKNNIKVVVIGAGIGGLSAAVRMAIKGYEVSVYDKNAYTGGKLSQFSLGKYRFDFGPSLFTMPSYVEELFSLAGKEPRQYFDYISLDEACRYFYPDGTQFAAPTDPTAFIQRASSTFGVDPSRLQKYFDHNENILNKAGHIFLNNSMYRLKTFFNKEALDAVLQTYIIDLFKTMNGANSSMLGNEHLIQLFNRYATYNGSSPYRTSAILNSISLLEHVHGTYFPKGGMYNITMAVTKLAEELGVKFYLGQEVERILLKGRQVVGVNVGGQEINCDIVISNMDVSLTYKKLLNGKKLPLLQRNHEKSSSAVIFYWGVKTHFDQLGLHNIFFSKDYKEEFDEIFNKKALPSDPTIYINISSIHEPNDAPQGCMNWFVMINAPADHGQDWNKEVGKLKDRVLSKLSQRLDTDMATLIEEEYIAHPKVIYHKTYSDRGALYGSSSNNWLNAFLRHPNFSNSMKGLYFVGGSVHPGGGIPLCLLSSKIATADL